MKKESQIDMFQMNWAWSDQDDQWLRLQTDREMPFQWDTIRIEPNLTLLRIIWNISTKMFFDLRIKPDLHTFNQSSFSMNNCNN